MPYDFSLKTKGNGPSGGPYAVFAKSGNRLKSLGNDWLGFDSSSVAYRVASVHPEVDTILVAKEYRKSRANNNPRRKKRNSIRTKKRYSRRRKSNKSRRRYSRRRR